jgi:MFS family permease
MVTPLLYGQMVSEHRLSVAHIGTIVTGEMLTLALAAGLAGAFLNLQQLRWKVGMAIAVFSLANLSTGFAVYPLNLVIRIIAGLCEGIFIWFLTQMFARTLRPARAQGVYLALQGIVGFSISAQFAAFIIPHYGATGGFVMLSMCALLTLALVPRLPRSLEPLPSKSVGYDLPGVSAGLGLAAIFFATAGYLAMWVYLPALATQLKLPAKTAGSAVALSLILQVVGGLAAALLATQIRPRYFLMATWLSVMALGTVWLGSPGQGMFTVLAGLFGFLWMFGIPCGVAYLIYLDPSRHSLAFLPTVQPLGSAIGPMLASFAVTSANDVRGAITVALVLLGTGFAILVAQWSALNWIGHAVRD